MAIVVGERGRVRGLVTLEDVLEEIVGEILDETDKVDPHVNKITKNTWTVLGKTDIDELQDKTGIKIKEGKYDTLGEFLQTLSKRIKRGKVIKYKKFEFKIKEMKKKEIIKVRVEKG